MPLVDRETELTSGAAAPCAILPHAARPGRLLGMVQPYRIDAPIRRAQWQPPGDFPPPSGPPELPEQPSEQPGGPSEVPPQRPDELPETEPRPDELPPGESGLVR
jgi:hypothetical protein